MEDVGTFLIPDYGNEMSSPISKHEPGDWDILQECPWSGGFEEIEEGNLAEGQLEENEVAQLREVVLGRGRALLKMAQN